MEKSMHTPKLFLLALTLSLISGCTQYGPSFSERSAIRQTAEAEDRRIATARDQRLHTQIQDLEDDLQRLDRLIAQQSTQLAQQQRTENQGLLLRTQDLEKRLKALEQQRVSDKKEIIDKISRSMADLIRKSTATAPATRKPSTRKKNSTRTSDYGYEHEVAPGETLSAIASAYHVSSQIIIDANNISNPNALRVGQKLFIPE